MAWVLGQERVCAPADVAASYLLFLGRPAEPGALAGNAGAPLPAFLEGVLRSAEFEGGVVSPLIDGRSPMERFAGPPSPEVRLWAAVGLALEPASARLAAAADDWRDLLLAVLADPAFGGAVDALETSWSRHALLDGLAGWTPVPGDAGIREEDWGESIPEREASLKRDAAERLRPDPSAGGPADADGPLITVLTTVYQAPLEFLARAIDSVRGQTYGRWELVLVDDGSTKPSVRSLMEAYAALEPRIRTVFLLANAGISAASNAGLADARGEWLALLDQDDLLTCDALQHVAAAVTATPGADLIYSDECFIDEDDRPLELFPKPDWSPLLMLNGHYISHLTVHRTARVRELGGFRSAYDFSQDYDLALRVTEGDPVVLHLDRVLYGWRRIEGSAAAGGKSFARAGNVAALQDALDRRGWNGFAEALPDANRARRRLSPPPTVALIVPSDNPDNIRAAVRSILGRTWYEAYEIVVVTTSATAAQLRSELGHARLRWAPYDRPFNFSDKCNTGAAATDAEFVVFFNDDVRVVTPDWIESLLEVATLPGVGAVGAKLLYEDGSIQHAGMVTGVRRLVGTAFHTRPADTHELFNLGAQSVREVSLICGALLMMRRSVFEDLDGFDAVETPVGHSDVDLCLRVREAGLSCVYTPHAVLDHIGHVSIGAEERARAQAAKPKDKSDIHLLKRFPGALRRDPFFPEAMRGLFYRDSQPRFALHPAERPVARGEGGRDVLILSNELTGSGGPKVVLDMARALIAAGDFVLVASRRDGPMRRRLTAVGAHVIVDSRLFDDEDAVTDLGRNFDRVIANTVVTWPAVRRLAPLTDVRWFFHEVAQVHRIAEEQPLFASTLPLARELWAGSALSAEALAAHGASSRVLPYGVDDLGPAPPPGGARLRVGVFGTFELRKGQDLAVDAFTLLPPELRSGAELHLWGRVLEQPFHAELLARAAKEPDVMLHGELGHAEYLEQLRGCDIVLAPSRDDTLPLVTLDALASGRVLVCSRRVGTSAYLRPGESGMVAERPTPEELAAALAPVLAEAQLRARISRSAREVFEREFTHAAFERRLLEALAR